MKLNLFAIGILVTGALFTTHASAAPTDDVGINLKAGTLGAGVEVSKGFSEKFSAGLGFNSYNYKTTDTTSGINYNYEFDLQTISLLTNYHPFRGVFRVTAGVMYNSNELKLTGKPSSGAIYEINGKTYTDTQVGTLSGKLTFNKTAPYFGLGWGNRPGGKLGISADVGALYQGAPKLALSASGNVAGLSADVEQERKNAEADLSNLKWYPVLSLGLYFRF